MNTLKLKEFLLGLALGFGSFTSFRIFNFFGLSELLFLTYLFFSILSARQLKFSFPKKSLYTYIILYFAFILLLAAPLMTLVSYFLYEYNHKPVYIMSFIISFFLLIFLINDFRSGLSLRKIVYIFSFLFIVPYLIMILTNTGYTNGRFHGLAHNPNQIYFYGACLLLLSSLYIDKLKIIVFLSIVLILYETRSDSFILSMFVTSLVYLSFKVLFDNKLSMLLKTTLLFSFCLIFLILVFYYFSEQLIQLWTSADEGNTRLTLFKNAIVVIANYPLYGFGIGNFSGLVPFGSTEAHNTFLDFSMQFGLLFSSLIYFVFFRFLFLLLSKKEFFIASLIFSFIISGLFHFNGRHFFFWFELSIFLYYLLYSKKLTNIQVR